MNENNLTPLSDKNPFPENNQNQTPTNTANNGHSESEYAEKQPLIKPGKLRRLKALGIGLAIFLFLGVVALFAVASLTQNSQIPLPTAPIDDDTEQIVEMSKTPQFAYIKNGKEIWAVDVTGENKILVLELSPVEQTSFTALSWKSPGNLTYTICPELSGSNQNSSCKIKTINLENRAVFDEFELNEQIKKMSWDITGRYMAIVSEDNESTYFKLKTGTIVTTLNQFLKMPDPAGTDSRVFFTPDSQNVIFSAISRVVIERTNREDEVIITPLINTYLLNGTKIDEIEQAKDPFLMSPNQIGYRVEDRLVYRTLGENEDTVITDLNGFSPAISPDKSQIAYWYAEGNLNNVILGVFDAKLNIHRNILRGIILPLWLDDKKIVGIKADNCASSNCQLYQFQTNSISIFDLSRGNVIQIDHGKKIIEPTFTDFSEVARNPSE